MLVTWVTTLSDNVSDNALSFELSLLFSWLINESELAIYSFFNIYSVALVMQIKLVFVGVIFLETRAQLLEAWLALTSV